ncbi:hypothetical protein HY483_02150 [Candidatus Woesearchaeota archaeon]|nr:hypothetical protein [Candidatus Woesearchaeota archaeon]
MRVVWERGDEDHPRGTAVIYTDQKAVGDGVLFSAESFSPGRLDTLVRLIDPKWYWEAISEGKVLPSGKPPIYNSQGLKAPLDVAGFIGSVVSVEIFKQPFFLPADIIKLDDCAPKKAALNALESYAELYTSSRINWLIRRAVTREKINYLVLEKEPKKLEKILRGLIKNCDITILDDDLHADAREDLEWFLKGELFAPYIPVLFTHIKSRDQEKLRDYADILTAIATGKYEKVGEVLKRKNVLLPDQLRAMITLERTMKEQKAATGVETKV